MKKTFWKNRKVFITGSTGLLGYWLTKQLVQSGAQVTILIRRDIPLAFQKEFAQVKQVKGTITNYNILLQTLKKHKIQTVFHLAAQTISPVANKDPRSTFETNITGTWNMLEACRNTSTIENIVVASSDKAYGESEPLPYTEESRVIGIRPYSVSKACADFLAQTYFESYNLPVCITRCGNLFGGGDLLFSRLTPSVVSAGLKKEELLIRSDGKFIRDFFYVEDGMLATVHLAEMMCAKKELIGQAFNFSYETPITVLDFVKMILQKMNNPVKPKILNQASNEIRNQYMSAQKAHTLLGWKPHFTIETGIERTLDWYIDYFKHYSVR
jgi:CDP-glucose 4,6-dehydratase